ncbi:MAG: transcription-repair coupling factor [Clostridia bacterium]|nr:transcription-repair coupling factor [Clostridia bacterium]
MLDKVLRLKQRENSIKEFTEYIRQGIPSAVFGVPDSFKDYLVGQIESPVLYIVKDSITASNAMEMISQFTGKKCIYLPAKDELLISMRAFSKDTLYSRIKSLSEMQNADVIVTTMEAVLQVCPNNILSISFKINESFSQQETVSFLTKIGYKRVEVIDSKGCFSVRGDVLDIFPVNLENPIRIDFFGDNVESIKSFNIETRESLGFIENATVIQATEFVFDEDDYNIFKTLLKTEISKSCVEERNNLKVLFDDIEVAMENNDFDKLSIYACVSKLCSNIFDLLKKDTVIVFDEAKRLNEIAELLQKEFTERFNSLKKGGETFSVCENNFVKLEKFKDLLKDFRLCALQALSTVIPFFNPLKIVNPQVSGVSNYKLDFKEVFTDIKNWTFSGYSVLACTGDLKKAENFSIDLADKKILSTVNSKEDLSGVQITSEKLLNGFIYHEEKVVVIGSGNLFSSAVQNSKAKLKQKGFFTAPEVGDYCVHEKHGIGRVLGNKKITTSEGTKDYISVEYSGGDILYVPVEQMDVLTRYLGGEKKPKLSKIGGADFERIKKSVKESIHKMSFDLKKLYSERNETEGFKFSEDKELEGLFANAFLYEDTVDQAICNAEILKDMTSGKVMDRLICGDVGFGKTEVAFRAIFRAIVNGKQCAMLAPTTILTEQHYNTAIERFKGFGVRIAVLNRFKSTKQQTDILKKLKQGEIDFIIGTHRLLSKDVEFKDLGLLVLDEEQRFGVEHKEKIKLLKKNVDALTLTATPIPRTLHMSLSGIRSISTINTPPKKRLPVQTYVTEETDSLICDVVKREVNRGGQVFIMYNRVESIFTFANKIQLLMPDLKIIVAHGQMDEKVLEQNILAFYRGESDVLISTTIIENGIDLPKANTLIVIDADRLGLSTLYQLKGRVGRSDRLAYAYFTFKREKILSSTAFDRLNAIIEFTEMGSGIKIAMRDLEIRGAGNVLGAQQHGHMDKIGYELYSKLLREEISGKEEKIPELDIRVTAFIPESYIESSTSRMDAYKEIAEINSYEGEKEFTERIESVYGNLPKEAKNLITISIVKFLAMKLNVSEIVIKKGEVSLIFEDFSIFGDKNLQKAIDEYSEKVRISMSNKPKLEFIRDEETNDEMLELMKGFLEFAKK